MATTIDPAVLQLVAQKSVEALSPELAPLNAFSTNYSDDVASPGSTIGVNIIGAPSATAQKTGASVDYSANTSGLVTHVNLAITDRYHSTFEAGDIDFATISNTDVLEKLFTAQLLAAAEKLETALFTSLYAAAGTQNATEENAVKFADLSAANLWMTKQRLPRYGRTLFLTPEGMATLNSDPRVGQSFSSRIVDEALREARVNRLSGFDVVEAPGVSAVSGVMGFAAVSSAMAVASRYVPETNAEFCFPVKAANGLTFCVKLISDPIRVKKYLVTEIVAGHAVIRATSTEKRALALLAAKAAN